MSTFYFALFIVYFFASSVFVYLVSLTLLPFTLLADKRRRLLHRMTSAWGHHFVKLNRGWKCRFENISKFKKNETYVIVANHQSIADTFFLAGICRPYKWVSKESLFRLPFFGWNMHLTRYIPIKRGDASSIRRMMEQCRDWLRRGEPVFIFPEGTRSESGELGKFRSGAFRLAVETNVPVLPVVIHGTGAILPKHSSALKLNADVTVQVLEPVEPGKFGHDCAALKEYVRSIMKNALSELERNEQKVEGK